MVSLHCPSSRLVARAKAVTALFAVIVMTVAAAMTLSLSPARAQQVFDQGHVDAFYVTADGGNLNLALKEDVTGSGVIHAGGDVVLRVNQSAWTDTTEGVAGIGAPTYFLPQTQRSDLVWPGWDTQNAGAAGFESVDFHFESVSGPGNVYVFETAGFGDIFAVTKSGNLSLSSGDVINQPYPAHRHVNWAFTQPGTYTMTVSAHSNGKSSNSVTYTWSVGDANAPAPEPEAQQQSDSDSRSADAPANNNHQAQPQNQNQTKNQTQSKSNPSTSARPSQANNANKNQTPTNNQGQPQAQNQQAQQAQQTQQEQLANTGHPMMTLGIGILGLGMLVLGLGIARLAAAQANRVDRR